MATRDFGILLGLAYQGFVTQLHADLARRGFRDLGPRVGYVLRALADEPMNQRQLSQRLGITDQGMMKIVDDMAGRGLVVRVVEIARAEVRSGKISERQLARLAGLSQPHLHNILKGVRVLTPHMADLILRQLHVNLLDLLEPEESAARSFPGDR